MNFLNLDNKNVNLNLSLQHGKNLEQNKEKLNKECKFFKTPDLYSNDYESSVTFIETFKEGNSGQAAGDNVADDGGDNVAADGGKKHCPFDDPTLCKNITDTPKLIINVPECDNSEIIHQAVDNYNKTLSKYINLYSSFYEDKIKYTALKNKIGDITDGEYKTVYNNNNVVGYILDTYYFLPATSLSNINEDNLTVSDGGGGTIDISKSELIYDNLYENASISDISVNISVIAPLIGTDLSNQQDCANGYLDKAGCIIGDCDLYNLTQRTGIEGLSEDVWRSKEFFAIDKYQKLVQTNTDLLNILTNISTELKTCSSKNGQGEHPENGQGEHPENGQGEHPENGHDEHSENGKGCNSENGHDEHSENGKGCNSENGKGEHSENGKGCNSENGHDDHSENGNGCHSENGHDDHSENGKGCPSEKGNGCHSENGNGGNINAHIDQLQQDQHMLDDVNSALPSLQSQQDDSSKIEANKRYIYITWAILLILIVIIIFRKL